MIYCKNCGVELEDDVLHCPLCGEPVGDKNTAAEATEQHVPVPEPMRVLSYNIGQLGESRRRRLTWEITSIVLLSGVAATLIINLSINKRITWSEYPVAVCLIVFSYVSFLSFRRQNVGIRFCGAFIVSSVFLLVTDTLTGGLNWALKLGIPLLFAVSFLVLAFMAVGRVSKYKGVNLIAYAFIAAGILCVCTDGILSFYINKGISLEWSLLVLACILPVSAVLLFVHFRLKRGRDLKGDLRKTFHT